MFNFIVAAIASFAPINAPSQQDSISSKHQTEINENGFQSLPQGADLIELANNYENNKEEWTNHFNENYEKMGFAYITFSNNVHKVDKL